MALYQSLWFRIAAAYTLFLFVTLTTYLMPQVFGAIAGSTVDSWPYHLSNIGGKIISVGIPIFTIVYLPFFLVLVFRKSEEAKDFAYIFSLGAAIAIGLWLGFVAYLH